MRAWRYAMEKFLEILGVAGWWGARRQISYCTSTIYTRGNLCWRYARTSLRNGTWTTRSLNSTNASKESSATILVSRSFSSLPPELVFHTVSTLHSARDIYALMSINSGLFQLLKIYLYQHNVDHARKQHQACPTRGNMEFILHMHVRNDAGQTILHVTAQQHDKLYIMMILLRDSRMDVNATDTEGRTPFVLCSIEL
jgi:hypothetical protein